MLSLMIWVLSFSTLPPCSYLLLQRCTSCWLWCLLSSDVLHSYFLFHGIRHTAGHELWSFCGYLWPTTLCSCAHQQPHLGYGPRHPCQSFTTLSFPFLVKRLPFCKGNVLHPSYCLHQIMKVCGISMLMTSMGSLWLFYLWHRLNFYPAFVYIDPESRAGNCIPGAAVQSSQHLHVPRLCSTGFMCL